MSDLAEVKKLLAGFPQYKELLYNKGFLITDDNTISVELFTNRWICERIDKYFLWHDSRLPLHVFNNLFLLGHAYNPYDMQTDEMRLLEKLSGLKGKRFWEYEADFTGVYVMGKIDDSGDLLHWADCAGMLISYYGYIGGKKYITSHVHTVANHLGLEEDEYITRLKTSRYFKLFGNVLPGDLSPFKELHRTVPNHVYTNASSKKRFYPLEPICECSTENEYQEVLQSASSILRNTLILCSRKWNDKNVAISLTGGKDSGVTLASASDCFDKFNFFSYISKTEEKVDADAAAAICEGLGLPHRIINVPDNNDAIIDYKCLRELISYNGGSVGYIKPNEVRKRSVLISDKWVDVEIKSWVDEISRAYWNKKYNKTSFPQSPNGKYLAALYKVFIENRMLFKQTSDVFEKYIEEYMSKADVELAGNWLTLWSWEFGHSAGEGQHMTDEQTLAFDVTVPFNNRHLISTMLKPKLEDRIEDRLQTDIIKTNCNKQFELGISVVNAAHTRKRAMIERAYLEVNSRLPL